MNEKILALIPARSGSKSVKNKKCNKINNISLLDDYLKNYCAYNCKWFLLKKITK